MRYRLRTLLIVLALAPVLIWGGWLVYRAVATEILRALIRPDELQPATFPDENAGSMP
jgi:hypothetical protein